MLTQDARDVGFIILLWLLFRAILKNAAHIVRLCIANEISKIALKMQAFYSYFMKSCLALNSYK